MNWKLLNSGLMLSILTIGCIVTGQETVSQPPVADVSLGVTTADGVTDQDGASATVAEATAAAAVPLPEDGGTMTSSQLPDAVTSKADSPPGGVDQTESPTDGATQADVIAVGVGGALTTQPDDTAQMTTVAEGEPPADDGPTSAAGPSQEGTTKEPEGQPVPTTAPPQEEPAVEPVVDAGEGTKIKYPDGETYRVSTLLVPPFVEQRPVNGSNGTQTELAGYIIDLLDHIGEKLRANFNISLVKDGAYGKKDGEEWTGIIGEVARGEADIGAAPLTVTIGREEVVDFTYSFMSFEGVAVIFRRHPLELPQIKTLEDMVKDKFQFAVFKGSNILKILESSQKQLHKDVVESIQSGDGLMESNDKGVRRARWDRKYAFLMESSAANLITRSEPCDLEMVRIGIYRRKYAMAVANLSPLRDTMNSAIVDLQVEDVFTTLMNKWFGEFECNGSRFISGSLFNMAAVLVISLYFLR